MTNMTIYALICSGKYNNTINGEQFTSDRLEVVAAFTSREKVNALLKSYPDVKEPEKWGVRSISVYEFSVEMDEGGACRK
jgi:hypothetical protein